MSDLIGLLFNPLFLLVALVLSIWHLRRTQAQAPGLSGAGFWWRRIALVMLVLQVVGLGICGGIGVGFGLSMTGPRDQSWAPIFLVVGGVGLLGAALLGWLAWRYTRPAKAALPTPAARDDIPPSAAP